MKKTILLLALAVFIFSSCQKNAPEPKAVTSEEVVGTSLKTPAPGPTPSGGTFNAKFTYSVPDPDNIYENQIIKFTSLGTGIVSYVWTFGNGTKLFDANPQMSYLIHGYYPVTLTVYDKDGNKASSTQDISILCNFGGGGGNHD